MGQKVYYVLPVMMEMQIKARWYFIPLRIRQHQMLTGITLMYSWVGTSVAGTILGKEAYALGVIIPHTGVDSSDCIVFYREKCYLQYY